MSQAQTANRAVPVNTNRQSRRPILPDDLSNLPSRRGRPGALEFFREIGVIGITDNRIKNAALSGELRKFRIAGHTWFSDADLLRWLLSLASGGQGGGDAP